MKNLEKIQQQLELVKVARGIEKAQLVLKNCKIVNVFTGKIELGDIAIHKGIIVGTGYYEGFQEIDYTGYYVCPGLIDGHVHIESSLLTPTGFARAVMPKGTTTVVADPHEIANVCGLDGIRYMIEAAKKSPLDIYIMLPSCVPSTEFENAGAILLAEDLETLINEESVLGLGEMMNYPGVYYGNEDVHNKLVTFQGSRIDGHAPGSTGKDLNSYVLSGVKTDHECVTYKELEEKVAKGMYIHLREGSATKNVTELTKGITAFNARRLMFCTDDKHPTDIYKEGHINYNVRLAIENKVDPITAIVMGSLNVAECYQLKNKGAIAPGYEADLVVLESLEDFIVKDVYKKGAQVSKDGKPLFEQVKYIDEKVLRTIHLKENQQIHLKLALKSDYVKVIRLIEDSIVTKKVVRKVDVVDGFFSHNPKIDILKLAVIERHKETGNVGIGLIEGFGLKNGSIGLTIAHDCHNMIITGDSDSDMALIAEELKRINGGIVIASEGKILGSLALEVGGIMTDAPFEEVIEALEKLEHVARKMGVPKGVDPFMTLAFLALPVIPELKVTDGGLFDVNEFQFVEIEE